MKTEKATDFSETELERIFVRRIRNAIFQGYTHIPKESLVQDTNVPYNTARRVIGLIGSTGAGIINTSKATKRAFYEIDTKWSEEELSLYIIKPPRIY